MIHLSCVIHSQHFKFINTLRIACTKMQVRLHNYEDIHTHANSSPLICPPPSHPILFPISELSSITGWASVPTLPVVLYLLLTISRVPPKTQLWRECVCMTYVLWKAHMRVWDALSVCVGGLVFTTLQVGCINYQADVTIGFHKCIHTGTHTQTHSKTEELAVFSSSHFCESDPWDAEKPQCQVCRFTLPPWKAETIQIQRAADGRGGHREQGVGVQSVLHTHQHTYNTLQIHTGTRLAITERV